jgi:hypothetical protein
MNLWKSLTLCFEDPIKNTEGEIFYTESAIDLAACLEN